MDPRVRFPPPPLFTVRAIDGHGRTNDARTPVTAGVFVLGNSQFHGDLCDPLLAS